MKSFFEAAFFAGNRRALQAAVNRDIPIIVPANGLLQRNGDAGFPFRQDSGFWYLTGIDEPDIVLVIDGTEEYLIVPERSASRVAFDGAVESGPLAARSAVDTVLPNDAGWARLSDRLKQTKTVAMPLPAAGYIEQYGLYTNPARRRLKRQLEQVQTKLEFVDIRSQLTGLRMVKQPSELAAIQQAIDITVQTFLSVKQNLATFKTEHELEGFITAAFRAAGAGGHAYQPIVAGGKNACTLHYVANNQPLHKGELVLLDAGAETENYAADITRTYAAGALTDRQQAVINAVLAVREFAKGLIKPGALLKESEIKIEQFMGRQLKQLGLIKTLDRDVVRKYFPHATSHFLGLDVHDTADYSRPLEPDMVLTVEPGIYIPDEKIGVRIEDDVAVTKTGHRVLSSGLPAM